MVKPFVLIIEAERITSNYYKNIFEKINIENVSHINNTFEIVPTLKRFEPDFTVIDVALLDEEISLRILDNIYEYKPELPLAVISSIFIPELIKKLKSFPYSEFFLKPLNLDKFILSVNKMIPNLTAYRKNFLKNKFDKQIDTNPIHFF